jgi:hypothetical protein
MKKLTPIFLALLLSACGGGGNTGTTPVPTPTPTPTPTPVVDSFFSRVTEFIGLTTEDAEARDVNAVAVTEPETTEPPGL